MQECSRKGTAPNVAGDQCQKSMRVFMFASWRLTGAFRNAVGKSLGRGNDGTCQRDGRGTDGTRQRDGGGEPVVAELVSCLGWSQSGAVPGSPRVSAVVGGECMPYDNRFLKLCVTMYCWLQFCDRTVRIANVYYDENKLGKASKL